jgi:hypothetical protein
MTNNNYTEQLRSIVEAHHTQYGKFLRRPENKHLLEFIENYESEKLKDNNLQTKIYWILNNIHDYPKCHNPNCPHGGLVKSNVRNIFMGYGTEYPTCCSSCAKHTPEYLQNWGDSLEEKYGARHPMHSQEVKDKVRETTTERWGGIGFASDEIHQKYEDKCMELYGVKNGGGSEQALKKIVETKMKRYNHPYFVFPMGEQGMVSKGEKEVLEYVRSIYNGTIIENDRTQMEPNSENKWLENHELDIWLPDIKVAIEFNGTYWHSLPNIMESDKFKRLQCESKGITLVEISESDWSCNKDICEGKLRELLVNIHR